VSAYRHARDDQDRKRKQLDVQSISADDREKVMVQRHMSVAVARGLAA
jgi:hypothetical protein